MLTFEFETHALRVVLDADGQPWFNVDDVCAALELADPPQALKTHVDPEDVQELDTPTPGGRQLQNHVNDSGLYALIMGSNKAAGRRFRRWVLPATPACPHHIAVLSIRTASKPQSIKESDRA